MNLPLKLTQSLEFLSPKVEEFSKKHNLKTPSLFIILGSGLGNYADAFERTLSVPYSSIPHFAVPSVPGHKGAVVLADFHGQTLLMLQGRIHFYEGHTPDEVVYPLRCLTQLVKQQGQSPHAIVTNAAGGIHPDYRKGEIVLINDHINFTGQTPLLGREVLGLGERFPDMSEAYDKEWLKMAQGQAKLKAGVYGGVLGPSYETPAEVRMLRTLGADLVGMSTVLEVIALRQMNVKVLGLSVVTNLASGLSAEKLDHEDVQRQANHEAVGLKNLLNQLLKKTFEAYGVKS